MSISYIKRPNIKLPQKLIYHTKTSHKYFPVIPLETSRMFETRTGIILGEMCTEPSSFTRYGTKFPAEQSLCIVKLRAYRRNEGVGTSLLNFARHLSHERGCEGRMHLISSDCYDEINPPHVFYRKYGFTSYDKEKIKIVDSHIKTGKPDYFIFNEIPMYYPADQLVLSNASNKKSFIQKIKDFVKNFCSL